LTFTDNADTNDTGKNIVYLDNAATSFPKAPNIGKEMKEAVEKYGVNPGRSNHSLAMKANQVIYEAREVISDFFNVGMPENIIFTLNATHAINFGLKGFLKKGDHVIISDREHNSVYRPLYAMQSQGIIEADNAITNPYDDYATVKNFEKLIKKNTKIIAVMSASNVTGILLPIIEISELAKKYGLLLFVDASQSGGILPINMKTAGIDILALPGHKGLLGPHGTGMLIVREGISLDTIIEGGSGINSSQPIQPEEYPERMESGTQNLIGIAGLKDSVEYVKKAGLEKIYKHELALKNKTVYYLSGIDGITVYECNKFDTKINSLGVVSFNIKGMSSNDVAEKLDNYGICVRSGLHCAPLAHNAIGTMPDGCVRASFGLFNKESDADRLIESIHKIARGK